MNCYSPLLALWSRCKWSVMSCTGDKRKRLFGFGSFFGIAWNRKRHQAAAQMGRQLGLDIADEWNKWCISVCVYLLFTVCVRTCPGVCTIFLSKLSPPLIVLFLTHFAELCSHEDLIIFAAKSRLAFSTSTSSRIALVCCSVCELFWMFNLLDCTRLLSNIHPASTKNVIQTLKNTASKYRTGLAGYVWQHRLYFGLPVKLGFTFIL